jgi:signal transduction histidine kinase
MSDLKTLSYSFQTRARTIDHLGRSQIADAPTAVSELWKNAYDAYATNVALHIFDGAPITAAVLDDGCGMDRDDFENRWLVIGTETKFGFDDRKLDTDGLPYRPRQGEKGIGRLSAAFLAPINVVIGKKKKGRYAAVAIDWRLFENPFLSLSDIHVPIVEFDGPEDLKRLLPNMAESVIENTTGSEGPVERTKRIADGWKRYSNEERKSGKKTTTVDLIREASSSFQLRDEQLFEWHPFAGLSDHGTAIFLADVNRELGIWVARDADVDPEAQGLKEGLRRTLNGFVDPYAEKVVKFDYEVLVHRSGTQRREVGSIDVFGLRQLRGLEHEIEGRFDKRGVFHGRVRAFGKEVGEFEHQPASPVPTSGSDLIGPFDFSIGTFEQESPSSSLSPAEHAQMLQQADKHAGLAVYRDSLRVMPYGRPDSDFFGLEERRSKHAGREFWAHRRVFGRVAFTKAENPNLRDKAGREGLVDNSARRWLQMLVVDLLKSSARRFFGTDSEIRKDETERIAEENKRTKAAADEARRASKASVRRYLETRPAAFTKFASTIEQIRESIELAKANRDVLELERRLAQIEALRSELDQNRPPRLPPKSTDMDAPLRKLRVRHDALNDDAAAAAKLILNALESLGADARSQAEKTSRAADKRFRSEVEQIKTEVIKALAELRSHVDSRAEVDRSEFDRLAGPIIDDIDSGAKLSSVQKQLGDLESKLRIEKVGYYSGLMRALELLVRGIDLEGALRFTDIERESSVRQVEQFHGLAQMGISAEIIGHELDTLEQEVGRNLELLPEEIRGSKPFKTAFDAHRALVDRLRFLSPLKMAGYRPPEVISGGAIAEFVRELFKRRFEDGHIDFVVTESFEKMKLTEQRSRIYPIFVNLVNNALYWIADQKRRVVKFDLIKDRVVIGDSGPGVPRDDQQYLFSLFFTRRPGGRGVGLYLCRANLLAGGHDIKYAASDDPKTEKGANFIIDFEGLIHAN